MQEFLFERMNFLTIQHPCHHFALALALGQARQRYPDLPKEEFRWRVIRRMQGHQHLGRECK